VALLMIVVLFITVYQVILRYFFLAPLSWVEEVSLFMFEWITMLGASVAVRRFSHIDIKFFRDKFAEKTAIFFDLISHIFVMVLLTFLILEGSQLAYMQRFQHSSETQTNMAFIYACIPCGSALMFIYLIEHIVVNRKTYGTIFVRRTEP
jgi:C4-dicarboxylate transporter DctQ subunit